MSVVCRPPNASGMEHLSLRVGLAVAEALDSMLPGLASLTIKRPNDLFLGPRKVAGILCEARWEGPTPLWVVVGIGLNVNNTLQGEVADIATSLLASGIDTTPDALAVPLATVIAAVSLTSGSLTPEEDARITGRELAHE